MQAAEADDGGAVGRLVGALAHAQFPSPTIALNAFSSAWPELAKWSDAALADYGLEVVDPQTLASSGQKPPTVFIGPPDRLHALCKSGYARVFSHALVAGGPVFPVVRTRARLSKLSLSEAMVASEFGPFAIRLPDGPLYRVLDGVEAQIMRAGTYDRLPAGAIGEVAVRSDPHGPWTLSGILSAFEMVPHRFRAAQLLGWLGDADPQVSFDQQSSPPGKPVGPKEMAALIAFHEAVLDARLIVEERGQARRPVLQVETEAGDWIESELAQRFRAMTGLQPAIERVVPGRLPPTGRAVGYRAAS